MPKKRQAEEDSDEAVSLMIKKAKVKTPAKTASTLAKGVSREKDGEGNPYWDVSLFLLSDFVQSQISNSAPPIRSETSAGLARPTSKAPP